MVIFFFEGFNVYGLLKLEMGVYCFVCILFFDLVKCCYILFVLVEVMLELDDMIEVEVCDDDIKMDIFCFGGVGG